ncbi:MAG: DUF456 domain-containing protein [Balneolaceae bacterium]
METVLIILASLCMIAGLIGALLPVVPGLPVSYIGLLLLQLAKPGTFSLTFMLLWLALVIIVMVLESVIPAYGTRRMGGSALGVTGALVGLVAGFFFFPPFGILIFPFLGAFAGEWVQGKKSKASFRAASGTILGFLAGTFLKVVTASVMIFFFWRGLF